MIILESHLRLAVRKVLEEELLVEYGWGANKDSDAYKRGMAAYGKAMASKKNSAFDKAREKTGHKSAYGAAAAAAAIEKPNKKESVGAITTLAIGIMWKKNKDKLSKTVQRFEPFVQKEKADELKKLKASIKSGKNTGPEQWVALAKLTNKRRAGEIMAVRLQWRQDIIDDTLDVIKSSIKGAISFILEKIKGSNEPWEEVKKIWDAVPENAKVASGITGLTASMRSNLITKSGIKTSAVFAVLKFFGKMVLKIGGITAAISAIMAIFEYGKFKSKMIKTADKLTGDDAVTLKHQFIPSNLKKGTAKKGYKGLYQGVEGDAKKWKSSHEYMKKAMGRG